MIAIISACGANFASVQFALERLGRASELTTDAQKIAKASHVILPGVGTATQVMRTLKNLDLVSVIKNLQQPVLGICLGMQILHEYSEEGNVDCLGIIPGQVKALCKTSNLSIPHMGWNQLNFKKESACLQDVDDRSYVYFVHSYAVMPSEHTLATTKYSEEFAAMVQHKNFYGAQFHPERSSVVGAKILKNFLNVR